MRISPVSTYTFTRKATEDEINRVKKAAENAKSRYESIQDKFCLQVDGGIDARLRAREFGKQYANSLEEGQNFAAATENYIKATVHPLKPGYKQAKAAHIKARRDYFGKVNEGMDIYYQTHEEDGKIAQQVKRKILADEEGRKIVLEMEGTKTILDHIMNGD